MDLPWEQPEIQVFLGKEEYTTITNSSSSSSSGNNHHHPPLSCYENKVCENKVFRPVLFTALNDYPSMVPVISSLLSDFGLSNILPYEILYSRSFLRAFAYLMCILPKDCPRVCLFIWQEIMQNPNSNNNNDHESSRDTWIQHFEIDMDQEPLPQPQPKAEEDDNRDGIFTFIDHLFRYFVDEDKRLFESLTVLSNEDRLFRIELNKKNHVALGCRSEDCCSLCFDKMVIGKSKACLTPCLHLFHPCCLFDWLKRFRRRKRACPICGYDLSDVAIDFADRQIWSFKYMPAKEPEEDLYAKYFECDEKEED